MLAVVAVGFSMQGVTIAGQGKRLMEVGESAARGTLRIPKVLSIAMLETDETLPTAALRIATRLKSGVLRRKRVELFLANRGGGLACSIGLCLSRGSFFCIFHIS